MNAQVHIEAVTQNGITCQGKSYFTPPFKVANITEDKRSPWLHLMLMNSSPGILDEDQYAIKIEVGENALLHLHTQSYQRIFTMKNQATQLLEAHLQKNAVFIHLPHPSVPHENASFTIHNKIFLTPESDLVWGEVLTCGRKLNGEVFRFSKYHSVTDIFINNKLVIKENLLMQPSLIDPRGLGQLEGFTHQASLICFNRNGMGTECLDEIHDYLSGEQGILHGISSTAGNGMIVRILGNGAEQLHQHLTAIAFLVQQQKNNQPVKTIYAG
jgi:urease accessory protein